MNQVLSFRIFIASMPVLMLCACVHSQIQMFKPENRDATPAVAIDPSTIGIYKIEIPFQPYTEIGLITLRTSYFDLNAIYRQLRTDAAPKGAQAIIAVKTKGETHQEWVTEQRCFPKTDCDGNGICSTHQECHDIQVLKDVTTFFTEGSMIRSTP